MKALTLLKKPLEWANSRPSRYVRSGGQPIQYEAPQVQTCTKVYKTAGQFKRGVEQMTRDGWVVVSQSSTSPNRVGGLGGSTAWTKTLVVFKRETR